MNCFSFLTVALGTLMVLTSCKEKPANQSHPTEGQATDSLTTIQSAVSESTENMTDDQYDLVALAKVIKGCEMLENFKNGVAYVQKDGEWFCIDKMGRKVEKPRVQADEELRQKFDEATKLRGFVDKDGKWVIKPQFEFCGDFSEDLCWVTTPKSDGSIGFIDTSGKMVIPCLFDWPGEMQPSDFHEGMCSVMVDGAHEFFTFINTNGKVTFNDLYSYQSNFSEGLAGVRKAVKITEDEDFYDFYDGYIDKTGKMVIEIDEDDMPCYCWEFHDGVAKVSRTNRAWFIDKEGRKLFELDGDDFYIGDTHYFSEGLVSVTARSGQKGYFDKQGNSTFDYND